MDDISRCNVNMMNMNAPSKNVCIPYETTIKDVRLAMAYVPYQKLCTLLSPMEALSKGTIFPELYSPYSGKKKKTNKCLDKEER